MFASADVPHHVSPSHGESGAISKSGSVDRDPAADPDLVGPNDGSHQQPDVLWDGSGR